MGRQAGVQMLQVAPANTPAENKEVYQSNSTFLSFHEHTEKADLLFHQRDTRYSIIPDIWI